MVAHTKRRVHPAARGGGARRLVGANVGRAEEELPVEIRALDRVHIGEVHPPPHPPPLAPLLTTSDTHQREALEPLASEGAGSDDECVELLERLLRALPKHGALPIVPIAARRALAL